jgi:hypothetical protein
MNRRDRELLDKQLRSIYVAPRSGGVLMLAVLGVFFAGITVGGFLYAYTSEPTQFAANEATPATSMPHSTPQASTLE